MQPGSTTLGDSKILLKNDRLAVEIAAPGSVYRGTRFDWSGFITQVTLDEKHSFCVKESLTPGQGTGGIGLCNEFGNDMPIGYDEAKPGEVFPKLGVGLLKRIDSKDYFFMRPYEIHQPFPIEIDSSPEKAVFLVKPLICRGYAVQLTKIISLEDNKLHIDYHLENVGLQPIRTNEYCHNFLGIDQQALGPDYRLTLPYPIKLENIAPAYRIFMPPWMRILLPVFFQDLIIQNLVGRVRGILDISENVIRFKTNPKKPFYCRPAGFHQTEEPQWKLEHHPSGVSIVEKDDFKPMRVAIWGTTHVISAEVFVGIDVTPGHSQRWSRCYEFSA